MKVWEIFTSSNFDAWFEKQSDDCKAAIFAKIYLLREYGPNLGRPYADTLKGSKKFRNLKELRVQTEEHVFRIAFVFDPERNGILLTGGDKRGKNEKKFYKDLVSEAEKVYIGYLEKKKE